MRLLPNGDEPMGPNGDVSSAVLVVQNCTNIEGGEIENERRENLKAKKQ